MGWAARANRIIKAKAAYADTHVGHIVPPPSPAPDPILTPKRKVATIGPGPSLAAGLLAVMAMGAVPAPFPPRPPLRPPRKR